MQYSEVQVQAGRDDTSATMAIAFNVTACRDRIFAKVRG
jgi:hypothetical protein